MDLKYQRGGQADALYREMSLKVNEYFSKNKLKRTGGKTLIFKALILLSLYLIPYGYLLWFTPPGSIAIILVTIMGFSVAGLGMGVMHDANHGSFSSNKNVNRVFSWVMYLLGGNVFTWRMQHNYFHHNFPNIHEADEDVDTKAILRLSPYAPLKSYHRFQFIYAWPMYLLMSFSMLSKDFVKIPRYIRENVKVKQKQSLQSELFKLIVTKVLYVLAFIALPIVAGYSVGEVLVGFVLMHFIVGFVLAVIFQLAHEIKETDHHDIPDSKLMETNWAEHQLRTTCNFACDNEFLSWYVGGLNFQVEHHLFPTISHIHYPELRKIVKDVSAKHGVQYLEKPTFMSAIKSHAGQLKWLGTHHIKKADLVPA